MENVEITTEQAQSIAMDAIRDGRFADADKILGQQIGKDRRGRRVRGISLTKTQAKKVSSELAAQGRLAEAFFLLSGILGSREDALRELRDAPTPTIGDVLYTSWGYDQTNIDFYQVVAIKGSSVVVRKIRKEYLPSQSRTTDLVAPVLGAFVGPPMTRRVQKLTHNTDYTVKCDGSYYGWLWNGQPKQQTAAGYGH